MVEFWNLFVYFLHFKNHNSLTDVPVPLPLRALRWYNFGFWRVKKFKSCEKERMKKNLSKSILFFSVEFDSSHKKLLKYLQIHFLQNLSSLFLGVCFEIHIRWFVELLIDFEPYVGIFNDWTKYWTILTLLCFWFVCFVLFRFVCFFLRRRHLTFITRQIAIAHLLSNCHCCCCCCLPHCCYLLSHAKIMILLIIIPNKATLFFSWGHFRSAFCIVVIVFNYVICTFYFSISFHFRKLTWFLRKAMHIMATKRMEWLTCNPMLAKKKEVILLIILFYLLY